MRVQCKTVVSDCEPLIIPRNIGQIVCDNNIVSSSEWYTISSKLSGYSISEGMEYDVYAILSYGSQFRYLLLDDYGNPGFFPAQLFSIIGSTTTFDWEVAEYPIASQTLYLIGYPALTQSYSNLVKLIDGEKESIRNLLEYKDYILRYSSF